MKIEERENPFILAILLWFTPSPSHTHTYLFYLTCLHVRLGQAKQELIFIFNKNICFNPFHFNILYILLLWENSEGVKNTNSYTDKLGA